MNFPRLLTLPQTLVLLSLLALLLIFLAIGYQPAISTTNRFHFSHIDLEFADEHRLAAIAVNNRIIVTTATVAHLNLTLNWAESLRRQGLGDRFIVFAIDPLLHTELRTRGIPCALIPDAWPPHLATAQAAPAESLFGHHLYKLFTHAKAAVVLYLLNLGYDVVFSDVDIGFPHPGFLAHLEAKVEESPSVGLWVTAEAPEDRFLAPYVNSGFYLARAGHPLVTQLFEMLVAAQIQRPSMMDQYILNEVMDILELKYNGRNRAAFRVLDPVLFVCGCNAFTAADPAPYWVSSLMVHANYLVGRDSKEAALRGRGLWYI